MFFLFSKQFYKCNRKLSSISTKQNRAKPGIEPGSHAPEA